MFTNCQILGEGWEGCVIKISDNTVMKIGFKETIINEMENLKRLPSEWQYFDPELITIREVKAIDFEISKTEKMKTMFEKIEQKDLNWLAGNVKGFSTIEKFDISLYGMTLPLIVGVSIDKVSLRNSKLMNSLIELHINIKELNERYRIFHNDLNLGNIMYDDNTGRLTVIDWGYATFGEPLENLFGVKYDIDSTRVAKYISSIQL